MAEPLTPALTLIQGRAARSIRVGSFGYQKIMEPLRGQGNRCPETAYCILHINSRRALFSFTFQFNWTIEYGVDCYKHLRDTSGHAWHRELWIEGCGHLAARTPIISMAAYKHLKWYRRDRALSFYFDRVGFRQVRESQIMTLDMSWFLTDRAL